MKSNKSTLAKTILNTVLETLPKRRRFIFISLATIVVIVGGYHCILQSDIFLLDKVVVKGNKQIPAEQIVDASGMRIGVDKIYSLSDYEIEKNLLQKFIYIKYIDIERNPPGTLIIKVIEREPIAIIPFHTENRTLYGLVDIEGFILGLVDAFDTSVSNMVILTGVLKEEEDGSISVKNKDIPLFLDNSLSSQISRKLEKTEFQIARNTLKCIIKDSKPNNDGIFTPQHHWDVTDSNLYSEILSINTKDTNKIALKLKNDSVVWLSSDYLEDGLCNFKTVFLYYENKDEHYNYIDARFEGVVYCGEESK